MTAATATARDVQLVKSILQRAASDLSMIVDRELVVGEVACERSREKVAGSGCIHLSFRLEIQCDGQALQGCLLVPLPDALAAACYLMVMPDDVAKAHRGDQELDRPMKDAMLEISNFIGGSTDAVLRGWSKGKEIAARSAGCQGVAPGAKPNFQFTPGDELIVGRARMTLHDYPPFEAVVLLPALLGNP